MLLVLPVVLFLVEGEIVILLLPLLLRELGLVVVRVVVVRVVVVLLEVFPLGHP